MPPGSDDSGDCVIGIPVERERWLVLTKWRMRDALGEPAQYNNQVPNAEQYSRAFPLTRRQDMIDLANLFLQTDYLRQGQLPATAMLREFFLPNAIRPTLMTFPSRNPGDGGQVTAWSNNFRALEFYAVLKARDVKNTALIQDTLDWRATRVGPEYVSVSITVPMQTEDDMVRFVQTLTGAELLDFMHPKCRVHLTNCARVLADSSRSSNWHDYLTLTEDAASEAVGEDEDTDGDASAIPETPEHEEGGSSLHLIDSEDRSEDLWNPGEEDSEPVPPRSPHRYTRETAT